MAKKQKYVYLQLYSKDLLADEKLAKCDKASAWGAYLALLNIMALEPIRGCVRLRDWDSHPRNERHSLVANFRKANSLRTKASAFARVVSQCTPLKIGPMAEGIEQLITFGVIVMHDDALIQPRLFRDSHSTLEGYNPEPEITEDTVSENIDNGVVVPHKKEKTKDGVAPAHALRANTPAHFESESKYNKGNNEGIKRGLAVQDKTPENNPDDVNGVQEGGFKRGKVEDGTIIPQETKKRASVPDTAKADDVKPAPASSMEGDGGPVDKIPVAVQPPTLREIQDYMQQRGEGGDPFRHITAEEFYDDGCQNGWTIRGGQPLYDWRARLRSLEGYRRKNGEPSVTQEGYVAYRNGKLVGTLAVRPGQQQGRGQSVIRNQPKSGDPVPATKPRADKYKSKW